ncbi:MAG: hypothetical protein H6555_07445 [Lewinellaceae bacterium]|nr:hypothetical protein [Lewinellaceae bacterium]
MKKYLILIALGTLLLNSACNVFEEDLSSLQSASLDAAVDVPLRKGGQTPASIVATNRAIHNYAMTENAYSIINDSFPPTVINRTMAASRSREAFLQTMILASLEVFDANIQKRGNFLSQLSRKNYERATGSEHEFEYDLGQTPQAAMSGYLKIGDIKGESTKSYPFAQFIGNNAGTAGPGCPDCWRDSLPPVKAPQLVELVEGLMLRGHIDSLAWFLENAQSLGLTIGLEPVQIGLLLPAVQKVREAAARSGKTKSAPALLIAQYGLSPTPLEKNFYQIGMLGTIGALINDSYDASGDLDWASLQLFRKKFEWEMFVLWSAYYDQQHNTPADPTRG